MIGVELELVRALDHRAVLQDAERREGLEEADLVLAHTDRVEDADVERAHLHVLDACALEGTRRALARPGRPLGPDEAVVLVLDLQDVRAQLPPFALDLDTELLVLGARREHQPRQVADVLGKRVDRHGNARLALVAVAEVAHPEAGRIRSVHRVAI